MTRARNSANLASHGNLFVDIANDRTGIGSVVPGQNLHVAGTAGFHADVTFTGDLYNSTWDRSDNSLKFVDNAQIKLGTGGDLQIYHDGSFSRFQNGSSGDILIKNSASGRVLYLQSAIIQMQPPGGGDVIFDGRADGDVKLYYDGSQKFQTTAYGTNTTGTAVNDGLVVAGVATVTTMNVTGVLTYDDVTSVDSVGIVTARQGVRVPDGSGGANYISVGDSQDLKIYHDGNNYVQANLGSLFLRANSGTIYLKAVNVKDSLVCRPNDATELYFNNDKKLETSNTGITVTGTVAATSYTGDGSALTGISVGVTTEALVKTNGQTASLDLSKDDHKVTATGTVTIDVTGGTEADSHTLRIVNSGIATVGFSTYFLFPSGGTPNLPTASGAISLISFTVHRAGAAGISTQLISGASVNFS